VLVAERVSRALITAGGIGTILAVTLMFVFLAWVVLPLFRGAGVEAGDATAARTVDARSDGVLAATADEYGQMALTILADGSLALRRLDDGQLLDERRLFAQPPTASAFTTGSAAATFGFADGSAVLGTIGFETTFLAPEGLSPEVAALAVGARGPLGAGMVERLARDQWRHVVLAVDLGDPLSISDRPLLLIDRVTTARRDLMATLDAGGQLGLHEVRTSKNLLTGKVSTSLSRFEAPCAPDAQRGPPARLLLAGSGSSLFLAWADGHLRRYDLRDPDAARLAETVDLVEREGATLTALTFLLGRATLLAGDSTGNTGVWFEAVSPTGEGGSRMVRTHSLSGPAAAVSALASSGRSRTAAVGYADGSARLFQVTRGAKLLELPPAAGLDVGAIALAPRDDALLTFGSRGLRSARIDLRHPEASLSALFLPVWYEGYPEPAHVWQSSGGTDDFEPKLGLVPLVFGTLKATLYSMLFGVPIALLGAVFASEFLKPRLRASLKSLIEMMASLPSVVLGFLAAIVIAPMVQGAIASVLLSFLTIPLALLLGAHLFQLLPSGITVRLSRWPRLAAIGAALPLGVGLAALFGPPVESLLFAGDFEAWLDGQVPGAVGGWALLLLPVSALLVVLAQGRWLRPWILRRSVGWSRTRTAAFELGRFAGVVIAAAALSLLIALALDALWLDPRGGAFGMGTYVQRNALVVGFVMGFAIIPIIYTLAEDALTSVPSHLREASLGAGATQWQTAVRVVVPTAMSGLYSAVMIGLGRAVGETMIVLMATGNTPVMEWNVFNGFRTLSANIAVELPEAVKDSTHYRTLFLAALVLFGMTFTLNTLAEVVRQRSRRRFKEL